MVGQLIRTGLKQISRVQWIYRESVSARELMRNLITFSYYDDPLQESLENGYITLHGRYEEKTGGGGNRVETRYSTPQKHFSHSDRSSTMTHTERLTGTL